MEEKIHILNKDQIWDIVQKPSETHFLQMGVKGEDSCIWIGRERQGSTRSLRILSIIWARL